MKPDPTLSHIRFARAYVADRLPWFAPALFRSRILLSEAVDVAAIDLHYNVYWNPTVVADIWDNNPRERALGELGFLWVHEISHQLREHADRAEARGVSGPQPARRWNVAADFEINDADWAGLSMPAAYPGMLPEQFGYERGLLAEFYYNALERDHPQLATGTDDGSGAHAQPRDWEGGPQAQTLSPLDEQIIRREVAQGMRRAGDRSLPESWRGWAGDVLRPPVDWRRRLGNRMSVALRTGLGNRIDYRFDRPNRRQSVYHPVLPPALSGDQTARIAVVVDTSGSMDDGLLGAALGEVAAVIRAFNYPVTVIPCDAAAYEPVRVLAEREAYDLKQLPGGGGTDLRAGIALALDLRPAPDAILVLTDGMTPYPTDRPATPVVFGIFDLDGGRRFRPPNPPWGGDAVVEIGGLN